LQDLGARTLVQDEASSVVYGMPRAALALDVVDEIVAIDAMGARLRALLAETDDSSPFEAVRWNRREDL
jgi:two-component system chemotaxis response regulator CheB